MYFRATNEKTLENIFNQIEELEKTEIEIEKYSINHDKNIYFIYILIFLFALLFIFKYKKD
jgi:Ca-activated chloride channel family protein